MTDDITRAVKQLRGLREDVERLKAAQDEEGLVRHLRIVNGDVSEVAVDDAVRVRELRPSADAFRFGNFASSIGPEGIGGPLGDGLESAPKTTDTME